MSILPVSNRFPLVQKITDTQGLDTGISWKELDCPPSTPPRHPDAAGTTGDTALEEAAQELATRLTALLASLPEDSPNYMPPPKSP